MNLHNIICNFKLKICYILCVYVWCVYVWVGVCVCVFVVKPIVKNVYIP